MKACNMSQLIDVDVHRPSEVGLEGGCWPGCWREHHGCAMRLCDEAEKCKLDVAQLEQELSETARERDKLQDATDGMPSTCDKMIVEFHNAFDVLVPPRPVIPDDETLELRRYLVMEECIELLGALGWEISVSVNGAHRPRDLAAIAKEAADLIIVTAGTLAACGMSTDWPVCAVHASNMTKTGGKDPKYPVKGKIAKGPDYVPPDSDALVISLASPESIVTS